MMAMATETPTLEALVRAQQDAMRVLQTLVDALRDVKKEEQADAEVRHAIRAAEFLEAGGPECVGSDHDLARFTLGMQQLLGRLAHTMKLIDELEAAQQRTQASGPSRSRGEAKPVAPAGLLSLRDYSVLQAALEVFFCWSAVPSVEKGFLLPIDRRRPTKTLGISRLVLQWGSDLCASDVIDLETAGRQVVAVTRTMLQVLLLPQIQPILLPKYVIETVALLIYGETNDDFCQDTRTQCQQMRETLLRTLPLRISMTSLRAALGQCNSAVAVTKETVVAFKQRCGQLLSQLLMEDGGLMTTIEMLLGAVDEGNTQARMQVATLVCQCPTDVKTEDYALSLARQVRGLFDSSLSGNKLLCETAVVLVNEMCARFPDVVDPELFAILFEPLLKYEHQDSSVAPQTLVEAELSNCVRIVHLAMCGPPPSKRLVVALLPLFRPLVHMYGFAFRSKSFLSTPVKEILVAFVKTAPKADVLLQVSVMPVIPPLRPSLALDAAISNPVQDAWKPLYVFAAGGNGGITMTPWRPSLDADSDEAVTLRRAIAALVDVLASKELESSTVVGELFSSLLLGYMRMRKYLNSQSAQDLEVKDAALSMPEEDPQLVAYESIKAPEDPLGLELALSLLLGIIESLGPSVLRSAETVLQCITVVLGMFARHTQSVVDTQDNSSVNEGDEDEDDDILTVCLGLVMTILEAGASTRPDTEEAKLRKMLPVLEALSRYGRPQIAELAADARAQILSRGAEKSRKHSHPKTKSFAESLREAAEDIQSQLVPLRARGVVTLTKLVRQSQSHRGDSEWTPRIRQLLDVFMDQLADKESYVYLAAVQGLSTLADAHGDVAIPLLTENLRNKSNSLEKRIKLSEALLFAAKRCGETLPKYAKTFVYSYLECIRPPPGIRTTSQATKAFSLIQEIDYDAEAASTGGGDAEDEARVLAANAALAEGTLRASCLSNLAEVAAMLQWSLAPYATDILTCVFGILQLELDMAANSVVAVRRGAIFLLKYVLQLMGYKVLEVIPDQMKPLYHTLKHVERVDKDEVVRFHVQQALHALDQIMHEELFPHVDEDEALGGLRALRIVKH